MTNAEILAAIAASPELQALAAARNDGALAAALSVGRKRVASRIITARGIAALYPDGPVLAEAVLLKLEGARDAMLASANATTRVMGSLLRRQLAFLASEGLDFGEPALRDMLDSFATAAGGNILTADEVAKLKGMALTDDPVPLAAVSAALNGQA